MNFHRTLPIPHEVKKDYPLSERMQQVKAARDASIKAVFEGTPDEIKVSANGTHIATVTLTDTGLSLKDPSGGELASCTSGRFIFDKNKKLPPQLPPIKFYFK